MDHVRIVFIFFFFVLIVPFVYAQKSEWVYRTYEGAFEVKSPAVLQCGQKTYSGDSLYTSLEITNCVFQEEYEKDGKRFKGKIYMVNIMKYPPSTIQEDSIALIRQLLEESIPDHINKFAATTVYKAESDYLNSPGLTYRLSYNDNKSMLKAKLIWANDRLFTIQCYHSTAQSLDNDIDRFINSFKLTKIN
jgi:hypothetical protein